MYVSITAAIVEKGAQSGAKNAADGFSRSVEGNDSAGGSGNQRHDSASAYSNYHNSRTTIQPG